MPVSCTAEDWVLRVTITGEVDHHRAREMMDVLDREIDMELPRRLTVDLGDVTFMDSSGIAVLLRAHRRVGLLGGTMTVQHVPDQAGKVLRAAGLDRLMKFE